MGHFKEAQGVSEMNDRTLESNGRTESYIFEPIDRVYFLMNDGNTNTRAWIIAPGGSNLGASYRALKSYLEDNDVEEANIEHLPYTRGGADMNGNFQNSPRGKAVIQWIHKPDGAGATMNIFAGSIIAAFSQEHDCSGNPTGGNHKRDAQACSVPKNISSVSLPPPSPFGSIVPASTSSLSSTGNIFPTSLPPAASSRGTFLASTLSAPPSSLPPSPSLGSSFPATTPLSSSAGSIAPVPTPSPSSTGNISPAPTPSTLSLQASVQAGSSPVHVGTLTGDALSTSIASALDKICPSITSNSVTACETGSVSIDHIDYKGNDEELNHFGTLEVKVEASSYNESAIRKAMIDAAALTAMHSAAGSNCYDDEPIIEPGKLKRMYNTFASTYNSLMPRILSVPPPVPEK
ncbi:MAG: hypothetical protein Q9225_001020 [Loekoesia sp. 1 TL-2023]